MVAPDGIAKLSFYEDRVTRLFADLSSMTLPVASTAAVDLPGTKDARNEDAGADGTLALRP
jgi:hypothetical protein